MLAFNFSKFSKLDAVHILGVYISYKKDIVIITVMRNKILISGTAMPSQIPLSHIIPSLLGKICVTDFIKSFSNNYYRNNLFT